MRHCISPFHKEIIFNLVMRKMNHILPIDKIERIDLVYMVDFSHLMQHLDHYSHDKKNALYTKKRVIDQLTILSKSAIIEKRNLVIISLYIKISQDTIHIFGNRSFNTRVTMMTILMK